MLRMRPTHPDREDIRLENVLAAFANPLRMAVIHVIAQGGEHPCNAVLPQVGKSTMTHHYRILRESGVARQSHVGREYKLSLRRDDLDARFPGLLDSLLRSIDGDEATLATITAYRSVAPLA